MFSTTNSFYWFLAFIRFYRSPSGALSLSLCRREAAAVDAGAVFHLVGAVIFLLVGAVIAVAVTVIVLGAASRLQDAAAASLSAAAAADAETPLPGTSGTAASDFRRGAEAAAAASDFRRGAAADFLPAAASTASFRHPANIDYK